MYGFSNPPTAQDLFRIDELLDLSNEELFTPSNNSSTTTNAAASTVLASTDTNQQHPPPQNPSTHSHNSHHSFTNSYSSDFTDFCVPVSLSCLNITNFNSHFLFHVVFLSFSLFWCTEYWFFLFFGFAEWWRGWAWMVITICRRFLQRFPQKLADREPNRPIRRVIPWKSTKQAL